MRTSLASLSLEAVRLEEHPVMTSRVTPGFVHFSVIVQNP